MKKLIIVGTYSIIHCLVDWACAMLIFSGLMPNIDGIGLVVGIFLYNMFAFAFQVPFGIIADKANKNAVVSAIGCAFVILAYFVSKVPILACVVAGIGNALFHVGGGIDVLNISNRKATIPGIFVSAGAIGLYIGSNTDYLGFNNFYIIIFALFISILILLWLYKKVSKKYRINNEEPVFEDLPKVSQTIIYCLMITICIRSYLGLIVKFDWKADFVIGLIFVNGVTIGKVLGGVIGDKFGFKRTSVLSLLASAVLFVFSFESSICGILAILFFNMTMPITLTILSNILNRNKGMAFGLTTLALFIGAAPVLLGVYDIFFDKLGLFLMTITSAIILYLGIKKYEELEAQND